MTIKTSENIQNKRIEYKRSVIISYVFSPYNTVRAFSVYKYFKEQGESKVIYSNFDHYEKKHKVYLEKDFIDVKVPSYNKNISLKRIISYIIFSLKLPKILKDINPDIVYVILPPNLSAYVAVKWAKKNNIKSIIDIVDLHPESLPFSGNLKKAGELLGLKIWRGFRNVAAKHSDLIITESDYYQNFLNENDLMKTETIHLTKDAYNPIKVVKDFNGIVKIAYLGSINNIYDFDTLLIIGESLKKKDRDFEIHIIGDGEKREWLIQQLETRKLTYKYYGKIYDDNEKEEILKYCHFGFNGFKNSTSVALSYKSIDYLYFGLPLINSCKLDTWEFVKNNNIGFNYTDTEIEILIEKITALSSEDIYIMKKNSRQLFKDNFSMKIYKEKMNHLVESL